MLPCGKQPLFTDTGAAEFLDRIGPLFYIPCGTMKTIDEALDYLYSFINYETDSSYPYRSTNYNVKRTRKLLDMLGNPEKSMRIIHVAGTKGKGSVCAIIDAVLRSQGYLTGLFTSPHIHRVNERISSAGSQITDEEFVDLINLFPPLIEKFSYDDVPTTFELLTGMAILHFKNHGVEYAVLETGMGGRFDSTNFADPEVSIITSISYDHMDKLGSHIEQIASEKAGIIKRGRPAVVGYQRYAVKDVFQRKCAEMGCPCYLASELCSYRIKKMTPDITHFSVTIDGLEFRDLLLSFQGVHQVENAVCALLALKVLNMLPDRKTLRNTLSGLSLPTRFEIFLKERRFLLDSAHNEDSARAVCQSLKKVFPRSRVITVVGIVKGKDVGGILSQLAAVSDALIITEPVTHKELDTDIVFREACRVFSQSVMKKELREAIAYACSLAKKRDLILITGSFYTTSPAREIIAALSGKVLKKDGRKRRRDEDDSRAV